MTDAVIVSTARTGLAKSWRGAFNMTHGATLGAHAVSHAMSRAKLAPGEVDDVVMGCALPEGATGWNIARQIALRAGCPVTVPGVTLNRFCSSGLQTIAMAAQRVIAGEADAIVAGGVESISCVQNEMNQHMRRDGWLDEHKPAIYGTMLQTAETVASRYGISRERQDEYGVQSQQRAAAALAAGRFADEIVPMTVTMGVADKKTVAHRDARGDDRGRRGDSHRHDARRRGEVAACATGRNSNRRQCEPVLRRCVGVRRDEPDVGGAARLDAARHFPRLRGHWLRAGRDGHRSRVRRRGDCLREPGSRSTTSTCGSSTKPSPCR